MRTMRKTEIEWIPNIPNTWEIKRNKLLFREVNERCEKGSDHTLLSVSEHYGIAPKSEKIADGEFETRAESLDGYKLCEVGDIVMNIMLAWKCSTGRSEYNGIVSPAYCVYRPIQDIDTRYYHYLFRTEIVANLFKQHSTGIIDSRLRLYPDRFLALKMVVPPLPEQQAISALLDLQCARIDTIIENTKSSIEEYKKLKQAIITRAVTNGVRGNRPMKDSGIEWIGEIPEEWNSINPKALFVVRKDKAKSGERQLTASQQYGVIYQEDYMRLTGAKVVTVEKDFDILKHVEAGDFVISMRSFQGGLEYSENSGSISSAYVMLIPNSEKVYSKFYKWLFKSNLYINALQCTSNMVRDGQAMRYSNFSQVRLYEVPMEEQKEIADYLEIKCNAIENLITKKELFLLELESYKKSLIYEYVTGKKEVKA